MVLRDQETVEVTELIDDRIVVYNELVVARKRSLELRLLEPGVRIKCFELLFEGLNGMAFDFVNLIVDQFEEAWLYVADWSLHVLDAIRDFTECSLQVHSVDHL